MAPLGTLYMYAPHHPGAHRALRILATAAFSGAEITLAPGYVHKETNLTPEFRARFPTELVPAFETSEGGFISEGSAVSWYIAAATKSTLLPTSLLLQAQIAQWQSFTDTELLPALLGVYGVAAGFVPGTKEFQRFNLKKALRVLERLERWLEGRRYLVGQGVGEISLADLAVVSGLTRGYTDLFDAPIQEKYPGVLAYYLSIIRRPEFEDIWGSVVLAEKSTIDLSE